MATKRTVTAKKTTSTAKTNTGVKAAPKRRKITAEEIRIRAAEIYTERQHKGRHGDELSDWLQAEKELATEVK
jgi:hypothetical protein